MVRLISFVLAAFLLASCATALKTPSQDLKINIIGTGEALCDVAQKGRRYRAYAPGSVRIYKDRHPLEIRCFAPGNRVQSTILEAKITEAVIGNVATGVVPGAGWDFFSGAMFEYPDEITMDFSSMEPMAYSEPDYQMVLDQNPEMIGMEEFRPGKAALIRDIGMPVNTLQRRPENAEINLIGAMEEEVLPSETPPPAMEEGGTRDMDADSLTKEANPNVFTAPPAESANPEDWQK